MHLRIYHGPNLKTDYPAVELAFDAAPGVEITRAQLLSILAGTGATLADGAEGDSWPLAEATGHLAASLQPGHPVDRIAGASADAAWVCLAFHQPVVTQKGLLLSCRVLNELAQGREVRPFNADLEAQFRNAQRHAPERKDKIMLDAARDRGIPRYPIAGVNARLWQFGQGSCGWHYIETGSNDDGLTGYFLGRNKHSMQIFLRNLGLPHTAPVLVTSEREAVQAARRLAGPTVVKPLDRGLGYGISVDLQRDEDVVQAYERASRWSRAPVMVERYVPGDDFRICVAGGKFITCYRRKPPEVTGDGVATIDQLIDRENANRQTFIAIGLLHPILRDEEVHSYLARKGYDLASVLPPDLTVAVKGTRNIAQGGVAEELTALVHPDIVAMVELLARVTGLRTMGVDYVTTDIGKSWQEIDGAILETNPCPNLPGSTEVNFVLDERFPGDFDGRLPTAFLLGDDTAAMAATLVRQFAAQGLRAALCDTSGAHVSGHLVPAQAGMSWWQRCLGSVLRPDVDAVIVQCSPADVVAEGLPLDRFDLAIVGEDFLASDPATHELVRRHTRRVVAVGDTVPDGAAAAEVSRLIAEFRARQLSRRPCFAVEELHSPAALDDGTQGTVVRLAITRLPPVALADTCLALRERTGLHLAPGAGEFWLTPLVAARLVLQAISRRLADAGVPERGAGEAKHAEALPGAYSTRRFNLVLQSTEQVLIEQALAAMIAPLNDAVAALWRPTAKP